MELWRRKRGKKEGKEKELSGCGKRRLRPPSLSLSPFLCQGCRRGRVFVSFVGGRGKKRNPKGLRDFSPSPAPPAPPARRRRTFFKCLTHFPPFFSSLTLFIFKIISPTSSSTFSFFSLLFLRVTCSMWYTKQHGSTSAH